MCKLLCVIFSVIFIVWGAYCNPLTVRITANGPIEGIEQRSSLGQKYYAFRGIPYAESPITGIDPHTGGMVDRRFKKPEPLKRKWTKNLKVHNFGDFYVTATDIFNIKAKTSEDCLCLFLNIYVPAYGAANKTVLVWIHGGAFIGGDTNSLVYGPDFLLFEDNIVVTVQYRLAIFGFLNLNFGEYTGNMGLKDQRLALKWIYENIEEFSGNKDEILLFGESAGGSSTHLHMLNEESRKYFNRAYIGSGSAMNDRMFSKDHVQRMQNFTNISDMKNLIEYLKTADSQSIGKCGEMQSFGKSLSLPWSSTIEDKSTSGAFITESPEEIYSSGKVPPMDTLFSFTSHEYIMLNPEIIESTKPLLEGTSKDFKLQLPFDLSEGYSNSIELDQAIQKLKAAHYPNTTNIDSIKRGNINLLSELNFVDAILKAVVLQTSVNNKLNNRNNQKKTLLFRFSVDADLNVFKMRRHLQFNGATHAEDLCYYFYCHHLDRSNVYEKHLERRDMPYEAIKRMVKIITNFARTGNPSIEGDTPFRACESSTKIFCQEISNNSTSTVTMDIMEQLHQVVTISINWKSNIKINYFHCWNSVLCLYWVNAAVYDHWL